MTGWTYWTANLPYFPSILYFVAGSALFWSGQPNAAAAASPEYFIGFSIAALGVAVALNLRGLALAKLKDLASRVYRGEAYAVTPKLVK